MPTMPSSEPASTSSRRLHSLDALRGFDMLWIMGGDSWIHALAELTGWSVAIWGAMQMEHMAWDGFRFYDMIFPLFLFIAGVAMPFSLTRRLERGDNKRKLMGHVIRRGLILVVLGIIYNNSLFQFAWDEMRYPSVLGRIGLAYLFAGLIVLNTQWRSQGYWFVGLLLGYWAAMMWIPVPGHGAGQLTIEGNLASYLDRLLLPGRLMYLDACCAAPVTSGPMPSPGRTRMLKLPTTRASFHTPRWPRRAPSSGRSHRGRSACSGGGTRASRGPGGRRRSPGSPRSRPPCRSQDRR